ncbi:unnamed protein product, partial [Symbiodinium sp. CCMP2456]
MSQEAPANASGVAESEAAGKSKEAATTPCPVSPSAIGPLELDFDIAADDFMAEAMETEELDDEEDMDAEALPLNPDMCECCQEEPKCERSVYGSECKKALNNVEKREVKGAKKKGDRWAKWCELKKAGGHRLHAVLLGYRDTCAKSDGPGKNRGSFDFMNHYEEVQSVAEVATGERLAYMPLTKWLTIAQEDHAMDVNEARKKWKRKEITLPPSQKRKSAKGVLLLPMPKEYYIDGSNKARHIKGMRLEGNKIKKPTAENFAQAEVHVSSGHLGFSDKAFGKVGGGALLDNVQAGASLMFAPDGDSIFGEGDNFRKHVPAVPAADTEAQLTPQKNKASNACVRSAQLAAASPDAATPASSHGCNTPGSAKDSQEKQEQQSNKKRKKSYDTVAARNKVVEKITEDLVRGVDVALTTALEEATKVTDQLESEFGDKAAEPFFKVYADTIQTRRALVELVQGRDSAALAAKIEENQNMKVATIDDAEKLRTLHSEEVRLTVKAYACDDEDGIKLALKDVKESVSMFKRLQVALNRATSDLRRALEQKKKRAAGLVEKRKREEIAKKKKEEKGIHDPERARERNRAQSAIKIQGVSKLKEAMLSYCSSKCSAFASPCNADLSEVGTYGFTSAMTYGGIEYFGMSTVRYAIKGEREIVTASAGDLWAVLQENGVETKISNERPVSTLLGERMWQSRLEEPWIQSLMLKGKAGVSGGSSKIFHRAVIPEGSLLFVPSGFVVCERSLNGKIGMGLRLSVKDSSEKAHAALQKLLNVHQTYCESTDKLLGRWE